MSLATNGWPFQVHIMFHLRCYSVLHQLCCCRQSHWPHWCTEHVPWCIWVLTQYYRPKLLQCITMVVPKYDFQYYNINILERYTVKLSEHYRPYIVCTIIKNNSHYITTYLIHNVTVIFESYYSNLYQSCYFFVKYLHYVKYFVIKDMMCIGL